ncbi:hypothetical protein CFIO01_01463 [Colletotrichum fioriniae PJ7]|uniref:Uncharacterized protein n=1 Tax=Colletotrichum fioriniae PJ7 TaxID=1445577 RepID=A0A010RT52_9PEZI|nr:hypothetical protein CFIO01_01463 [Colletotrichum fioriniae PJ7]
MGWTRSFHGKARVMECLLSISPACRDFLFLTPSTSPLLPSRSKNLSIRTLPYRVARKRIGRRIITDTIVAAAAVAAEAEAHTTRAAAPNQTSNEPTSERGVQILSVSVPTTGTPPPPPPPLPVATENPVLEKDAKQGPKSTPQDLRLRLFSRHHCELGLAGLGLLGPAAFFCLAIHAAYFLFGILLVVALHFTRSTANNAYPFSPLPPALAQACCSYNCRPSPDAAHLQSLLRLSTRHRFRLPLLYSLILYILFFRFLLAPSTLDLRFSLSSPLNRQQFIAVFDSLHRSYLASHGFRLLFSFSSFRKEAALLDNPLKRSTRFRHPNYQPPHRSFKPSFAAYLEQRRNQRSAHLSSVQRTRYLAH